MFPHVHTSAVPDIPGLKAESPAAQGKTVGPLPTAPPLGFQQLLRVVVACIEIQRKQNVYQSAG